MSVLSTELLDLSEEATALRCLMVVTALPMKLLLCSRCADEVSHANSLAGVQRKLNLS